MADNCVFCEIISGLTEAHVVLDEPDVLAFLDSRPLFEGHTLVVPRTHFPTLTDLPVDNLAGFFGAVQRVTRAVQLATSAQGSFVAANNVVSQSVPHLHFHVVPRTKGDGLKGFFWPRRKYSDEHRARVVAQAIKRELTLK